jgi:hypothetical protein
MTPSKQQPTHSGQDERDALLADLEQAWAELRRAERRSRTYLARQGTLDQTHVDLTAALRRIASPPTQRAGRGRGER